MPADVAALCSGSFISVRVFGRIGELVDYQYNDHDDGHDDNFRGDPGSGGAIPGAIHVWPYFRADRTSPAVGLCHS